MTEISKSIPKWILIVSAFFALMEIMVSIALCIMPESVVDTVDLGAKGVDYLIYMWAARQFALGIIFGFATLKQSIPMLTSAYLFFLVMFLGDLFIGIQQNNPSMIAAAIVMCVMAGALLWIINKKKA